MTAIAWLLPVALFLGGLGLCGFLWSLRSGQYEDMEGAANRILFDDPLPLKAMPVKAMPVRGEIPDAGKPRRAGTCPG